MKQAMVIAHRGFSRDYPENTMIAFEKALEVGADMIELDAMLSADGDFIVIHDEGLGRGTIGKGLVCQLSTEVLKRTRAAKLHGAEFADQTLVTLDDVVDRFGGKIELNIELKPFFPLLGADPMIRAIRRLLDILKMRGISDSVIISSSNVLLLDFVRQCDAQIRLGVLHRYPLTTFEPFDVCNGLNAWSLHPYEEQLTDEMLIQAHAQGLKVIPYTVDDPARMRELLTQAGQGVDGIFTNCPDIMLGLLGRS